MLSGVTIILSVATCGLIWTKYASAKPPRELALTLFEPGQKLEQIAGFSYNASARTLILMVRRTCSYCTASMPFYRQLAVSPRTFRFVVVSRDDRDVTERYLARHGLRVDAVLALDSETLRALTSTPLIVVVNRLGEVEWSRVGQLGPEAERDLESLLQR